MPFFIENFGPFFEIFWFLEIFLPYRFFISKKQVFSAGGVAAGAFFSEKKVQHFGQHFGPFFGFFWVWVFFVKQIFYKQKRSFFGWCIPRRAPSGRAGPGPPSLWQGGNIEKVHRKKCPRKLYFTFWEKYIFGSFYLSKRSDLCLERQISSRGSGSNFFLSKIDWKSLEL